ANYHKGEAFPFQLLIFLFTHNYLNTQIRHFKKPFTTTNMRYTYDYHGHPIIEDSKTLNKSKLRVELELKI
ncbi:hypothetical protein, partial [Levilactobacillus yonginensis]|uniref:hypothetical protein n=1 Tax=Levilactobacillus yonginensis TaxID=1054041 RepID=UPI001CDD3415